MKFSIQTQSLNEALQKTLSIIEKKNTVPILSNFLLTVQDQGLSVSATNLEVGMKSVYPLELGSPGRACVPAKYLSDIVKDLSDKTVTIVKKDNHWIEVTSGKFKVSIVSLPGEDYPVMPSFEERDYIEAKATAFVKMIDQTSFAVSNDSTRYHLNGVYFEPLENCLLRMTATDGHRLSLVDEEIFLTAPNLKKGVIIPRKGLTEIRKLLGESEGSVQLAFDRQYLFCKIKNTSLFVRLIDGEYPDYKQVIPKMSENAVKIEKNILLSALKRVSHSANEKSRAVRFHVHPGMMVISSSNPEMGDAIEEIDVDYQGNEIDIAFNSKYLMDYLLATTDEVIELHAKDRINPGILKGLASDHQKYVIMPMRI